MEKSYPTRNHLPISTRELDLPPSQLNPHKRGNVQNHHLFYYSGRYKKDIILNSLRDLEMHQEPLARDQHVLGQFALHNVYRGGVPTPSLKIAMGRLSMAYETGEMFKVWDIQQHRYVYHKFSKKWWERLQQEYNTRDEYDRCFAAD